MEVLQKFKESISNNSTRVFTGIGLIALVFIIGIINSPFIIWCFLGAITYLAIDESLKLFKMDDKRIYIHFGFLWIIAYLLPNIAHLLPILYAVIFASVLAYKKDFNTQLFLPLAYPIAPMMFILGLYVSFGIGSLLWLLVIVALTDIGAYFTGKSMGKTKFCETSPNKTIEGVIGGIFLATFFGSIIGMFIYDFKYSIIFISFLVAVTSIFGDLFESFLKRQADVKDSGNLLPGHGGVLDRVDGYLFGGIAMFVLMQGLL